MTALIAAPVTTVTTFLSTVQRALTRWLALILYEVAWFIAGAIITNTHPTWDLIGIPIEMLFWGMAGGVTAAIFAVWQHALRADFDPKYVPWYLVKPPIGGMAGALVFLLSPILGLTLTEGALQPGTGAENEELLDDAAWLYIFAFVLGFFETTLLSVLVNIRKKIEAVIQTVFGN